MIMPPVRTVCLTSSTVLGANPPPPATLSQPRSLIRLSSRSFTLALERPPQQVQARHVAVRAEREENLPVLRPVGLVDQGAVALQREGVVVEVLERSGRTVPPQHQRAVLD